jgi:hypothetical protein
LCIDTNWHDSTINKVDEVSVCFLIIQQKYDFQFRLRFLSSFIKFKEGKAYITPAQMGVSLQRNYPPSIIDVEASGFGARSYPIEIGIVRYDGAKWCKLIRPVDSWVHWDQEAESLHGITRAMLNTYGVCPVKVCHELNAFLSNTIVYSDGWVVDNPWLIKLFAAASVQMSFSCRALEYVLSEPQMALWHDVKTNIESQSDDRRHRASTDAKVIQSTYVETRNKVEAAKHKN